ncbi:MAG: UDP-N-acetylmuramoyl-tripeptide--D-alanyl-D-alanine ligase [Candidatus Eisenbacteria bacterium]|nr:UDP-N-acetylmuramoyl-tripeptide--D-alanyl-D-alanine ligase [Candidatus Eisenbacteria bacterium]
MNGYSVRELARILAGTPLGPAPAEGPRGGPSASIDTRTLRAGDLFFALPGEKTDGHRFVGEAFRKGASLAVVRKDRAGDLPADLPRERILAVADAEEALVRLAAAHRARFSPRLSAVTGSNGKTTTKELLAAILSADAPTLASPANFNTILGLSLTLLRLEVAHRWAVVELGISAPGEMDALGALARPDTALLTNAHAAHLEGLGSVKNVAREKCRLLSYLEGEAAVYANGDDPALLDAVARTGRTARTFGWSESCAVRPERVEPWNEDGVRLAVGGEAFAAPVYGMHNAYNLLAALAVARGARLGAETIRAGLARFQPPPGRFRPERAGGVLLIDDTYNANLASARGAIDFLQHVKIEGKRVLVFGDMRELGDREEEDHREVGRAAARAGLDRLVLVGECVRWTAEEALRAGLPADRVERIEERQGLGARLASDLEAGDCLVIKGSRAMRMEEILGDLRSSLAAAAEGNR